MKLKLSVILLLLLIVLTGMSGEEKKIIDHYQLFEKREGVLGFYWKDGDPHKNRDPYDVSIYLNPNKINFHIPVPDNLLFGGTVDDEIHYEYYVKNDKERTISFYKKNKMHILTIKFIDLDKFQIIEVGEWIDPIQNLKWKNQKERDEFREQFEKRLGDQLNKERDKEGGGALWRFGEGGYYDLERVYTCF